jgi:hypothetical protein
MTSLIYEKFTNLVRLISKKTSKKWQFVLFFQSAYWRRTNCTIDVIVYAWIKFYFLIYSKTSQNCVLVHLVRPYISVINIFFTTCIYSKVWWPCHFSLHVHYIELHHTNIYYCMNLNKVVVDTFFLEYIWTLSKITYKFKELARKCEK